MIISIIHIIVSYDQNISLIFYVNDGSMSGFDIRLVFLLVPRDSTLQYKRCVHFWNNFPCIPSLPARYYTDIESLFSLNFIPSFLVLVSGHNVDGQRRINIYPILPIQLCNLITTFYEYEGEYSNRIHRRNSEHLVWKHVRIQSYLQFTLA